MGVAISDCIVVPVGLWGSRQIVVVVGIAFLCILKGTNSCMSESFSISVLSCWRVLASLRSYSRPVSIYAGMGGSVGGLGSMGGNRVRRAEPVRPRL